MTVQGIVLLVIFLAVLSVFAVVLRMLIRSLKLGKPEDRFDRWGERVWSVIVFVGAQARVLAQISGLGHFIIFYGFIFISLGTFEHIGGMIFPGFSYRFDIRGEDRRYHLVVPGCAGPARPCGDHRFAFQAVCA